MKKVRINKKFIALALAGTMTLAGCINASNKEVEAIPRITSRIHTEADYNYEEGYKEIKTITTKTIDDKETNTFVKTEKKALLPSEYEQKSIITTEEVNVRKEPNTDSEIIDTIESDTHLIGLYNNEEWYRVIYDNEIAYVNSEYIYEEVEKKGTELETKLTVKDDLQIKTTSYVQATDSVNIRSDATADSNSLGILEEGQRLEGKRLLDNGWYEVIYNGKNAYIKSDYVKEVQEDKIITPFNKIVMFNQESDIYSYDNKEEVINTVPTYEVAYVYGIEGDKYISEVNNKLCYINTNDVSDVDKKIVIVDISDQHATLYDGNKVIVDTPVVTGKDSTPTDLGYFGIVEKQENAVLRGPGYASPVDYWMLFNENEQEGLHDAEYHIDYDENGNVVKNHGWRTYEEFGTEYYHGNGSHGCTNLPIEAAKNIYNNVEIGTKVLVKK